MEAKQGASERTSNSSEGSDDDSPPQLSAHALAALQEFYAEEAAREQQHMAPGEGEGGAPAQIAEDWVNCIHKQVDYNTLTCTSCILVRAATEPVLV